MAGEALTYGVHHTGLAVTRLEESAKFFTGLLGWKEIRRDEGYPAIFVSDGRHMLTLWQVEEPKTAIEFDRKKNVGLHHIAIQVRGSAQLEEIHRILVKAGIKIEFPPELLRGGPARHMMVSEPSGIRVEFIWPGNQREN